MLHHCTQPSISNFRFYDISGANATDPQLLNQFDVNTHEFFLWEDPNDPERALIFAGSAGLDVRDERRLAECPFSVWDISPVPDGAGAGDRCSADCTASRASRPPPRPRRFRRAACTRCRSATTAARAYFALLTGGFAVVDVSDFANGRADAAAAPDHDQREPAGLAGARERTARSSSGAVTGPGSPTRSTGRPRATDHGCPWGWARMIDISDPTAPTVEADYRLPENDPSTCDDWNPPHTSYSAHNPTLTPHIAFSTWHSGGFQAVSIQNARAAVPAGRVLPGAAATRSCSRIRGSRPTRTRAGTRRS